MLDNFPSILKVEELGQVLRIGRNQAYELCRRTDFYPAFKVGDKSIRVSKKLLIEWLESNDEEMK